MVTRCRTWVGFQAIGHAEAAEVPVLKSWQELGLGDMPQIPVGTRASMDGYVPADITMESWLAGKSQAMQDAMLGKGRAELWRSGKITLTDLVDQRGRPLSLHDLRQRLGIDKAA